jgi:acyl-CoA synthetase (NDP forming)/GNAT superfamily N-acetyltransferase
MTGTRTRRPAAHRQRQPRPSGTVPGVKDALARDGAAIRLRAVLPDDLPALSTLFDLQSDESRYSRFLCSSAVAAHQYVGALTDPLRTLDAILAMVGDQVIGVGSTHDCAPGEAEIALLVDDHHHGHGVGTLLVEELVRRARRRGVDRLVATILHSNAAMIDVFSHLGLPMKARPEGTVLEVSLSLAPAQEFDVAAAKRSAEAASESLRPLLRPDSVVVVGRRGASRAAGQIADRLVTGGFHGEVYTVGVPPSPLVRAQPRGELADVPEHVDLAILAVPVAQATQAVRECLAVSPRAIAVLDPHQQSSRSPAAPHVDTAALAALVRERGSRMLGLSSSGIVNTDAERVLRATAWSGGVDSGTVGVVVGGPFGAGLAGALADRDIGVSLFLDVGSAADVRPDEALSLVAADPRTRVIAMALPHIPEPEAMTRAVIAARSDRALPILLFAPSVQSVPQPVPERAESLPTADDDACTDAWCREVGVTRVSSLAEVADAASLLVRDPLPSASRVVILGNDKTLGLTALEACSRQGLLPPDLTQHTEMRLRMLMGAGASLGWLVEARRATPGQLRDALVALAEDPGVDGAAISVVSPSSHWANELRRLLGQVCRDHPGFPCVMGIAGKRGVPGGPIPEADSPRAAVAAVASVFRTVRARRLPTPPAALPSAPPAARARAVRRLAMGFLTGGSRPLERHETHKILEDYGIPTVPVVSADGVETALEAAQLLRYPVSLAGYWASPEGPAAIRTVRRGLSSPSEVRAAVESLRGPSGGPHGIELWSEVTGVDATVVAERRQGWDPVVTVCRTPPRPREEAPRWIMGLVSDLDAEVLVRSAGMSTAGSARPWTPAHPGALAQVLRRVSVLMNDLPQVRRLVIPVTMTPRGEVWALDATLRADRD